MDQNRPNNSQINDELYRLVLIDADRIFRMGMRFWLAQFADIEVVGEAETASEALEILQGEIDLDLIILDLNLDIKDIKTSASVVTNDRAGVELCQRLKSEYSKWPVLLLISAQAPELLDMALGSGVEGYCLKGTNPDELIAAIRQVASGDQYLGDLGDLGDRNRIEIEQFNQTDRFANNLYEQTVLGIVRRNFYLSGMQGIDRVLTEVKANLANTNNDRISDRLTKIVLAGQVRELQAARWLVDRLWGQKIAPVIASTNVIPKIEEEFAISNVELSDRLNKQPQNQPNQNFGSNVLAVQASLWDKTIKKIQFSLLNLGKTPIEIDVLKEEKKRGLLYITLHQVEQSLTDLRLSKIRPSQLNSKIPDILKSIWQGTVIDFFGKYYILENVDVEVNVVDILLGDIAIIQIEFLDRIPQFDDLLCHLLFETELVVDNSSALLGTTEAMQRAELILDNLIIQIANAVIQPLLNNFANVEEIKQNFYRYNLLATREIERFRNDLSWKYRLEKYITNPQLIFESRHVLLTFTDSGIKRVGIYTPRNQELQQLEGVQLAVTLVLELQDAIAPRLKSAISFIGSGFVYVLTNVIGRGIGLIGRGVVQGIGNAWQETRKK